MNSELLVQLRCTAVQIHQKLICSSQSENGLDMTGILLVLDYVLVRQALKIQIELEGNLKVIGEAEDCYTACQMAQSLDPDVIIIDLDSDNLDGFEVARELAQRQPHIPLIILYSKDDPLRRALLQELGSLKLVLKHPNTTALIEAIHHSAREHTSAVG